MSFLINGIGFGLTLSILVGPIFFALIQSAIERGFRAGAMVGLGVWVSDLSFILLVYYGMSTVRAITSMEGFKWYTGIAGSAILISFGLATIIKTRIRAIKVDHIDLPASNFSLWLKGFLLNTVNPFTVFFWLGVISTVVVRDQPNDMDAWLFLGGIFGTVVFTDLLKVAVAKRFRYWLRPGFILWLRYISGSALFIFGIVLLYKTI